MKSLFLVFFLAITLSILVIFAFVKTGEIPRFDLEQRENAVQTSVINVEHGYVVWRDYRVGVERRSSHLLILRSCQLVSID